MSAIDELIRAEVEAAVKRAVAGVRAEILEHITVAEYARRWSLSESTVRQAIADKRLEVDRIGRAVRIAADAKIARRAPRDRTDRARLRLLRGGNVR